MEAMNSSTRALLVLSLANLGAVAACAAAQPSPQPTPNGPTASASTTASTAPAPSDGGSTSMSMLLAVDGGGATRVEPSTVVPSWRSSISFSNITGRTGDQTAALFTPSVSALEGCRGANGGKLVLRLHSEGGHVIAEPQAGTSVDPTAKQCVLDALSRVHVDDTSNVGGAAPVKAMGFTSLLTIEW
jgi:hypothetical protein